MDEELGFDLDLTYITENVLAMGFPSEKMERMYRNPYSEVFRFLETRHGGHYRVYNLCSERSYDKVKFQGRVATFPFDDHNAPPLELMRNFCEDVASYLSEDPQNIAAVHCKAGKGRTGVMICAYLLHVRSYDTAEDALQFYGSARTQNGKGVTIPSQARYVKYYEEMVRKGVAGINASTRDVYKPKTTLLTGMTVFTLPRFGTKEQGCNLQFSICMGMPKTTVACTTSSRMEHQCQMTYNPDSITMRFPMPIRLIGDVKIEFYHQPDLPNLLSRSMLTPARTIELGKKLLDKRAKKMCHFWFNTAFIPPEGTPMRLRKEEIDRANKDKQHKIFDAAFAVELRFSEPREKIGSHSSEGLHLREEDRTRHPPRLIRSIGSSNAIDFGGNDGKPITVLLRGNEANDGISANISTASVPRLNDISVSGSISTPAVYNSIDQLNVDDDSDFLSDDEDDIDEWEGNEECEKGSSKEDRKRDQDGSPVTDPHSIPQPVKEHFITMSREPPESSPPQPTPSKCDDRDQAL